MGMVLGLYGGINYFCAVPPGNKYAFACYLLGAYGIILFGISRVRALWINRDTHDL